MVVAAASGALVNLGGPRARQPGVAGWDEHVNAPNVNLPDGALTGG